jgi:hypothetical protein
MFMIVPTDNGTKHCTFSRQIRPLLTLIPCVELISPVKAGQVPSATNVRDWLISVRFRDAQMKMSRT